MDARSHMGTVRPDEHFGQGGGDAAASVDIILACEQHWPIPVMPIANHMPKGPMLLRARLVFVIRKIVAAALITGGAFLVLWFFIAVAYLTVDPSRRGIVEICLAFLFLGLGLAMIMVGYRGLPG